MPEKLELKQQVFRDLDAAAPADTILASNTSGFPIGQIAEVTARPELVIGWHWASPPAVMRLAEIVRADRHQRRDRATTVVEVADRVRQEPGRDQRPPTARGASSPTACTCAMIQEANRCVDEGIATREQVDTLMVDCFRWPVGPFGMVQGATSGWGQ